MTTDEKIDALSKSHQELRLTVEKFITKCDAQFTSFDRAKATLYGDDNGNKGLIRRADAMESRINQLCVANRLLLGVLLTVLAGVVINIVCKLV